jgi:hypothetical protein
MANTMVEFVGVPNSGLLPNEVLTPHAERLLHRCYNPVIAFITGLWYDTSTLVLAFGELLKSDFVAEGAPPTRT